MTPSLNKVSLFSLIFTTVLAFPSDVWSSLESTTSTESGSQFKSSREIAGVSPDLFALVVTTGLLNFHKISFIFLQKIYVFASVHGIKTHVLAKFSSILFENFGITQGGIAGFFFFQTFLERFFLVILQVFHLLRVCFAWFLQFLHVGWYFQVYFRLNIN